MRLRLFFLPLATLSMFAVPTSEAHAKTKPAVVGSWELVEDVSQDGNMCVLIGRAAPTTWLLVRMNASEAKHGGVSLMFSDIAWSIKAKDDLGTMRLSTPGSTLTGAPDTADNGFLLSAKIEDVVRLFDTSKADGVALERNFETIARIRSGNMSAKLRELQACGQKLAQRDPFAK